MGRLKRSPKQPALRASVNNLSSTTDSPRELSPGLTANLPSNNPFRNRATSPANSLPSPVNNTFNIPSRAPERPVSRNPFLDQSDKKDATMVQMRHTSPERGQLAMNGRPSPKKPALTGHAVDLFVSRSLRTSIRSLSHNADFGSPRTTSRSMTGIQPPALHRKVCLLHIPIVPHDPRIPPQSLLMAFRDTIHHDHRKMASIDRTREEGLKDRSRTSSPIHQKREDRIDGPPDEPRIRPSPAGN